MDVVLSANGLQRPLVRFSWSEHCGGRAGSSGCFDNNGLCQFHCYNDEDESARTEALSNVDVSMGDAHHHLHDALCIPLTACRSGPAIRRPNLPWTTSLSQFLSKRKHSVAFVGQRVLVLR